MFRLLAIPAAVVALLAAAVWWSGGGTEKRADFAFINRGDIYTLDLNQMSYMQDFRLTYGIREGLYGPDPETLRPVPAGATGYELSDDKKVWTFHLRPGAKWSNGDPVTSRDYVFSWRRMLEEPGEYTYLFYYIKNAQEYEKSYTDGKPISWETVGIAAPDDLTLRVTLNNPVTYLLELLAFPPFYPRNERSMRPFRVFLDSDVFDPVEKCLAAAGDMAAAGSGQQWTPSAWPANGKTLAKALGRPVASVDPEAAKRFVLTAAKFKFRLGEADLSQVMETLDAFAALKPFDGEKSPGPALSLQ